MNATQSLKIYDLLNAQFGQPERARQLTEAIEDVVDDKVQEGAKTYEALLHKDLEIIRLEMATKQDLNQISERLGQKISDQMRWIISLFIPLYLSIIGLFVTILLKR